MPGSRSSPSIAPLPSPHAGAAHGNAPHAGADDARLVHPGASGMTVDDLPMRPHSPGASTAPTLAAPLPYRDPGPRHAAPGGATLVDMDEHAAPAAARARTISPYWIGMLLLFVAIVAGAGLALKLRGPRQLPSDPAPTIPVAATPGDATPAPETPAATPPPPPTHASISISTNLPSEVLVEGVAVGRLPAPAPLVVPPGKHRIALRDLAFGVTIDGEYEVEPGGATSLSLPFNGNGFLQLRVRPWAEVTIDGDAAKSIEVQAAFQPISLAAGEHRIDFEQLGKRLSRTVFIVPRQTVELSVDMGAS